MTISLSFKVSTGTTFDLQIDSSATVAEVKRQAAGPSGIADTQMRLIYKGRILKDTETLEQNKIESGHTVHLVKGPGASAAPAASASATSAAPAAPVAPVAPAAPASIPAGGFTAPSGLGAGGFPMDPSGMAAMMQNPMMQQMMGIMAQNPEMMANMLRANPEFQRMAQQNPHLNLILQNPDLMRVMLNPQMMQAALQMQQAFASSMNNPPAGGAAAGQGAGSGQAQALMQMLQQNPELAQALLHGGGGGEEGEAGEFNAPPPPAAVAELEERFRDQLEQMALMGFTDRLQNIEALRVCDGNVEAAINYILTYGN
jgi:ubiquilin